MTQSSVIITNSPNLYIGGAPLYSS